MYIYMYIQISHVEFVAPVRVCVCGHLITHAALIIGSNLQGLHYFKLGEVSGYVNV